MTTAELIHKFLEGKCDVEEHKMVMEYFEKNPEEWDKYLSEDEWDLFEANGRMQTEVSDKLFEKISAETFEKTRKINQWRKLAIAASIVLMVGFGWIWMANRNGMVQAIAKAAETKNEISIPSLHLEINNSGKDKKIFLEDGSSVVLADKSEISYALPFTATKRDIILKGKAEFKVAKDKSRPFTVFSGNISTTALGTRFVVSDYPQSNNIYVTLYEGKIVVKNVGDQAGKMDDCYLVPWQQLVYNKMNNTARLSKFKSNNAIAKKNTDGFKQGVDNPSMPHKEGSWYMFNNQPLIEVFDELEQMFNVHIVYAKKDVAKIYFIGEFKKSDSIETILQKIAFSNGLTVAKQEQKFVISR